MALDSSLMVMELGDFGLGEAVSLLGGDVFSYDQLEIVPSSPMVNGYVKSGSSGVPTLPTSWPVSKSVAGQTSAQVVASRARLVGSARASASGSSQANLCSAGPLRIESCSLGTVTLTSPWLARLARHPLPSLGALDEVDPLR